MRCSILLKQHNIVISTWTLFQISPPMAIAKTKTTLKCKSSKSFGCVAALHLFKNFPTLLSMSFTCFGPYLSGKFWRHSIMDEAEKFLESPNIWSSCFCLSTRLAGIVTFLRKCFRYVTLYLQLRRNFVKMVYIFVVEKWLRRTNEGIRLSPFWMDLVHFQTIRQLGTRCMSHI